MTKLKRKPDGLGKSKTYLGKIAVPAKPDREAGSLEGISPGTVLGKLTMKEIKFLEQYASTGAGVRAIMAMYPKASYNCAHSRAWAWMKKIDAKITPEEKFCLMGVTTGKLAKVVSEAMDAKFQKEFVTRDGVIVAGHEHPDHQVRMDAAKLSAKLLGLDKENNNPTIAINIVQFAPPGSTPWPASGSTNPEVIDITAEEI